MATATQVGIRFTEDDFALIQAIMARTGIGNRTDVVRLALRRLAAAEGIVLASMLGNDRKRETTRKKIDRRLNK